MLQDVSGSAQGGGPEESQVTRLEEAVRSDRAAEECSPRSNVESIMRRTSMIAMAATRGMLSSRSA